MWHFEDPSRCFHVYSVLPFLYDLDALRTFKWSKKSYFITISYLYDLNHFKTALLKMMPRGSLKFSAKYRSKNPQCSLKLYFYIVCVLYITYITDSLKTSSRFQSVWLYKDPWMVLQGVFMFTMFLPSSPLFSPMSFGESILNNQ